MSTNTGPAYLLKPGFSIFDVINQTDELTILIKSYWRTEYVKRMVNDFYFESERYSFKEYYTDRFNSQRIEKVDPSKEAIGYRTPTFVFHQNSVTKEIAVRLVNFPEAAEELYQTFDHCGKSYEYHNSSDSQLSYLSKKEWAARAQFWSDTNRKTISKEVYEYFEIPVRYDNAQDIFETLPPMEDSINWRRVFSKVFLTQKENHDEILKQNWSIVHNAMRFVNTGNMAELETSNEIINRVKNETDIIFNNKVKPFTE